MYDAKNTTKDVDALKYACMSEVGYFPDLKNQNILNLKTTHVPITSTYFEIK